MIESSDLIMFEVYRAAYDLSDRVVYYSELEDKDDEIDRALAGRPSYDGFIPADHRRGQRCLRRRHQAPQWR